MQRQNTWARGIFALLALFAVLLWAGTKAEAARTEEAEPDAAMATQQHKLPGSYTMAITVSTDTQFPGGMSCAVTVNPDGTMDIYGLPSPARQPETFDPQTEPGLYFGIPGGPPRAGYDLVTFTDGKVAILPMGSNQAVAQGTL